MALTDAATARTGHMEASGWARPTIREPARMRAAPQWTGPGGSRAAAQKYNPRTGTYGQTRQGSNVDRNWGSSSVQRGDNWAQTAHRTNYQTGTKTSGIRTSEGGGAVNRSGVGGSTTVGRTAGGDVYAGHDGNVYRRNDSGGWEQSNGSGGWTEPEREPSHSGRHGRLSRPCPERPIPECDSSNEPARTRLRCALGRQYQNHDAQQLGIERFVEIGSGQLSGVAADEPEAGEGAKAPRPDV